MDVNGVFRVTNTNSTSRNLNQLNNRQEQLIKQLSSGVRLVDASVDAAGMGVAKKMEAALAGHDRQIMNLQDEYSRDQVRDGALSGVSDMLQRINTLQIQARNDTLTDEDRAMLQMEVDQLVEGIGHVYENTTFNDRQILESGEEVSRLIDEGVDVGGSLSNVRQALSEVNAERGDLGAALNVALESINRESVAYENTLASYSRINDMDMARGMIELNRSQVASQANVNLMENMFNFNKNVMLRVLG